MWHETRGNGSLLFCLPNEARHKCFINVRTTLGAKNGPNKRTTRQPAGHPASRPDRQPASQLASQPANQPTRPDSRQQPEEQLLKITRTSWPATVSSVLSLSTGHGTLCACPACPCLLIPSRAWGKSLFSAKYFT